MMMILNSKYNYLINTNNHSRIISALEYATSNFVKAATSFNSKRWNHHLSKNYPPLELNYKCIKGSSDLSPIVICHGMLGSHQNWSMIGKRLNQETGRSVYMPDMRNHGSSPHSSRMTYYDMASDIQHFVNKLELGKVVALGTMLCALIETSLNFLS